MAGISMLDLTLISGMGGHQFLNEFLRKKEFMPLVSFSPYSLMVSCGSGTNKFYHFKFQGEEYLIKVSEEKKDVRFLLYEPTPEVLKIVTDHFKPEYVGINELGNLPQYSNGFKTVEELIFDVETIVELKDKKVLRDYITFKKKHPFLQFVQYVPDQLPKIQKFLDDWSHTRSEEKNKHAKIYNDLNFLDLYGNDPGLCGGVVFDEEKIVGITFCVPTLDGNGIGVINKTLREYTQLGVFIFVERARLMKFRGYKKGYIGHIQNDFKKKFTLNAEIISTYCYEGHKKDDLDVGEKYLFRF